MAILTALLALTPCLDVGASWVRPGAVIVLLVKLEVTFTPDPLPAGQIGEISMVGTFEDGTVRELAAEEVRVILFPEDLAELLPDGRLRALKRGTLQVWVHFLQSAGFGFEVVSSLDLVVAHDRDRDGLPDDYEEVHQLDPDLPEDAELDVDGDLLTNLEEFDQGTDPHNRDTDGDRLDDGLEVALGFDPLAPEPPIPTPPGGPSNENCRVSNYQFPSVENETYRVELVRWERYGLASSDMRFVLLVRKKGTDAERTVTLENLTTKLEEAEIGSQTLVLFGEMGSKAGAVTLMDLETAGITDFILHYGASLSPSGQYLVFKAFYPPYGRLENRSDAVMVYDLSKGPAENRLPEVGAAATGQSVGLPVYPLENVDPATYLVRVPDDCQRHYIAAKAGFLWAKDEKSLFFIDRTGDQQLLVQVDLGEGLRRPRIASRPIDARPALTADPEGLEPPPAGERKFLAVSGMALEPDGRIRLELDQGLFERKIYRSTHLSVTPPGTTAPIQEPAKVPY